jgi:hypothetical protein
VTHHDFFLVLKSVCEHSDYRLLLGTTRQVPTNRSWVALLRHSKNGTVATVTVSEHAGPNEAIGEVFRQLDLPEPTSRPFRPGTVTPTIDHPGVRRPQRPRV